ncbi:MAG: TrbC/VirB2 family protein [Patescibacteria group bacterium]
MLNCQGGEIICNPLNAQSFSQLVEGIADIVFKIGFPIMVIFIIYAGLLFVTARGNEEDLKKAKRTFFWALIGSAIILGAKLIAIAIRNLITSI